MMMDVEDCYVRWVANAWGERRECGIIVAQQGHIAPYTDKPQKPKIYLLVSKNG